MNRIEEIMKKLEEEEHLKEDRIINPKDIAVDSANGLIYSSNLIGYKLNDWSVKQFCQKLGIPTKYYEQCPNDLKAENANYWINRLREDETDWFFRLKDATTENEKGTIRGILSDKYTPFDDIQLLKILKNQIGEMDYSIDQWHQDDSGFHLRILFESMFSKNEIGKTIKGEKDIHKVGIHVMNSEVGKCSVKVSPVVYRQVCSNGLMSWVKEDEFQQRHIYIDHEQMEEKVAVAIDWSIGKAQQMIDKLMIAKNTKIEDPFQEIERIGRQHQYQKYVVEDVKNSFEKEPMQNVFGLVQAFTHASQKYNQDKKVEMERNASKILEMAA